MTGLGFFDSFVFPPYGKVWKVTNFVAVLTITLL